MNEPASEQQLDILIISLSPIASDARVLRQVRYFSRHHRVTTVGYGERSLPGIPHIQVSQARDAVRLREMATMAVRYLRLSRLALRWMPEQRSAREQLAGTEWDLVIADDVLAAPIATTVTSKYGILADLHEYAPRQSEESREWRLNTAPLMRWILKHEIAGKAAAVTTVSQGIADEYRRVYGLDAQVVTNASPKKDLRAVPMEGSIRLVHSGTAAPQREIEVMVDGVKDSSADVTLDLFLMPSDPGYLAMLKARVADDSRIRFHDPVVYDELVSTLNRFDVGLAIVTPINFNHEWCLPNKFFDFVQARLGVICGPSPEMARFVEQHAFGAVTDGFTAAGLTRVLDALSADQVAGWKSAAELVADDLSSEQQDRVWGGIVERLTGRTGFAV